MKKLIPGPYTFILPATREVPKLFLRKRKTIGIRVPNHPVTHALLAELGQPLVSTSAKYDEEQLCDADELMKRYKQADFVIDSGLLPDRYGTILDLCGDEVEVIRVGLGDLTTVQL